mgnify:CR=1 FL=1
MSMAKEGLIDIIFRNRLKRWNYSRAIHSSRKLVLWSVYKRLRSLGIDISREEVITKAVDLKYTLIKPTSFISLVSNVSSDNEDIEKALLSCDYIRSALGNYFSVWWQAAHWLESDKYYLKIECYENALKVLGIEPSAKSFFDVLNLTKKIRNKIKTIRQELGSRDQEEATDAVYSELFPEPLNFLEWSYLIGMVTSFYLVGTYLFTHTVFYKIGSEIVGINQAEYFMFATNHCLLMIPMVVVGMCIALSEEFAKAKNIYLSHDFGNKTKRFTSFDVLMWISSVILNIPLFQYIFGFQDNGWQQVLVWDFFLVLLLFMRFLPYERIVSSWFAIQISLVLGMLLMCLMVTEGLNFSESLKEPSAKDWVYTFNNTSFSSDDYSLVFDGERLVFYDRESKKLVVMNSKALISFSGNL